MNPVSLQQSAARLAGQCILVTGAGRGIGRALAIGYAAHGADVVCVSRTVDQITAVANMIRESGGRALAVQADVTDASAMRAAYDTAEHEFGGVDTVVLNAGAAHQPARLEKIRADEWHGILTTNVIGVQITAGLAVPMLRRRGGGRLILLGSGSRLDAPAGLSMYAASKAAAWTMLRSLAKEVARDRIAVLELIPGPVRTAMIGDVVDVPGEWVKDPEDLVDLALLLAGLPVDGPTAQTFSLLRRPGA
jgi:3-oxoacyl-[acyl-carrier protein] reductase